MNVSQDVLTTESLDRILAALQDRATPLGEADSELLACLICELIEWRTGQRGQMPSITRSQQMVLPSDWRVSRWKHDDSRDVEVLYAPDGQPLHQLSGLSLAGLSPEEKAKVMWDIESHEMARWKQRRIRRSPEDRK